MYRTRRDWLLAEAILGWIAISTGLSAVMPTTIHRILYASGDLVPWASAFIGFGLAMLCTSLAEQRYRKRPTWLMSETAVSRFARLREYWHFGLAPTWAYTLFLLLNSQPMIGAIIVLAPAMLYVHVLGGWENVKAYTLRGDACRGSVLVFLRERFRRRTPGAS